MFSCTGRSCHTWRQIVPPEGANHPVFRQVLRLQYQEPPSDRSKANMGGYLYLRSCIHKLYIWYVLSKSSLFRFNICDFKNWQVVHTCISVHTCMHSVHIRYEWVVPQPQSNITHIHGICRFAGFPSLLILLTHVHYIALFTLLGGITVRPTGHGQGVKIGPWRGSTCVVQNLVTFFSNFWLALHSDFSLWLQGRLTPGTEEVVAFLLLSCSNSASYLGKQTCYSLLSQILLLSSQPLID